MGEIGIGYKSVLKSRKKKMLRNEGDILGIGSDMADFGLFCFIYL